MWSLDNVVVEGLFESIKSLSLMICDSKVGVCIFFVVKIVVIW